MDLEEITLFEKLSQLEAYQGISNSTYILPSSSVLSPLLNNEIQLGHSMPSGPDFKEFPHAPSQIFIKFCQNIFIYKIGTYSKF